MRAKLKLAKPIAIVLAAAFLLSGCHYHHFYGHHGAYGHHGHGHQKHRRGHY